MTDTEPGGPTYVDLANKLRTAIYSGKLAPGAKLPSEAELISQYGVSRVTARGAFRELQNEGLVETQQGKGTVVRDREAGRHLKHIRYQVNVDHVAGKVAEAMPPFSEEPGKVGEVGTVEADIREVNASSVVAAMLELNEGDPVLERKYVYRVGGQAERLSVSYLPAELVRDTPITDVRNEPWTGGTIAQLASIGQRVSMIHESIGARMPTPLEFRLLGLTNGVPVQTVTRRMFTGPSHDLKPVEASPEIVIASDRVKLDYETHIDISSD